MKALFLTTQTVDCLNHVRAYESAFGPAEHVTFDHRGASGISSDWRLIEAAEKLRPDVIFYIGANEARGNPKTNTFATIRKVAPFVNFCSDAADVPWHNVLEQYRRHELFDLQVGIDGCRASPVDLVTLTPVDPRPFKGGMSKDVRAGFSGTVGRRNDRSEIVNALHWLGGLAVRRREEGDSYYEHAEFMRRCQILFNVSQTGSGMRHHIKGRVLEAGWAQCCLLESEGSPIADWFPDDCYIMYEGAEQAADLIKNLDSATIQKTAKRLAEEVRGRFTPKQIYGEILERVGLMEKAA